MFFSEEKNQKTFMPALVERYGTWPESDGLRVKENRQKEDATCAAAERPASQPKVTAVHNPIAGK